MGECETDDKYWRKFVKKHWSMLAFWIVAAVVAVVGGCHSEPAYGAVRPCVAPSGVAAGSAHEPPIGTGDVAAVAPHAAGGSSVPAPDAAPVHPDAAAAVPVAGRGGAVHGVAAGPADRKCGAAAAEPIGSGAGAADYLSGPIAPPGRARPVPLPRKG